MSSARSSSRYTIHAQRSCTSCHQITDQTSVGCRYSDVEVPKVPKAYLKHVEWVCDWCGNCEEEVKEVLEPTDRMKLVKRLLSIQEDNDVLGFTKFGSERDLDQNSSDPQHYAEHQNDSGVGKSRLLYPEVSNVLLISFFSIATKTPLSMPSV